MRRLISILCLTFLVFSMAMPTLSLASAADETVDVSVDEFTEEYDVAASDEIVEEELDISYAPGESLEEIALASGEENPVVNLGDSYITLNGKSFSLEGVKKGLYDFEMNEDGTYNGELTSFYTDSKDYPIGNKKVADFATETGLTDTEGHGNVIVIPGSENQTANCRMSFSNLSPNAGTSIKSGLFVVTFDILFTQGAVSSPGNLWTLYVATTEKGYTYQSIIYNPWKIGGSSITYNGKSVVNFTNNEWKRVGIIFDIDNDYYHFIIDNKYVGSEKIANTSGVQQDITEVGRIDLYPRGAAGGVTCFDNAAIYHYKAAYNAEVTDAPAVKDSVWNLKFDAKMSPATLPKDELDKNGNAVESDARPISIVDEAGKNINFVMGEYNIETQILPLTIKEKLRPGSTAKVVIANTVATDAAFSYPAEYAVNVLVNKDAYGIDNVDLVSYTVDTLPLGETINPDVYLRTESAQDANLVLALYVDGALCSISSKVITAASIEAKNTLPLTVPAEAGEEYEIRAILLGSNYEVIDTVAAQ